MIFPLNSNTVEQVDIDPEKKINGYVWFNRVEKVYKTWIDGKLNVFLMDKNLSDVVGINIETVLQTRQFVITFNEVMSVVIKHDKKTKNFNYTVFDDVENCNLNSMLKIIDENEVVLDFVDPVTGRIFMYFD